MRDIKSQKKLDSITEQDKKERTTIEAMRERGIIVEEFKMRALCFNEYPYIDRDPHFVLRRKEEKQGYLSEELAAKEFVTIRDHYSNL